MPYRDWVVWQAARDAEEKALAAERAAARDLADAEGQFKDDGEEDQWPAESDRLEEESQ